MINEFDEFVNLVCVVYILIMFNLNLYNVLLIIKSFVCIVYLGCVVFLIIGDLRFVIVIVVYNNYNNNVIWRE